MCVPHGEPNESIPDIPKTEIRVTTYNNKRVSARGLPKCYILSRPVTACAPSALWCCNNQQAYISNIYVKNTHNNSSNYEYY